MDQLANDLSYAIIGVEDIKPPESSSRLRSPDGRSDSLGQEKMINYNLLSSNDAAKKSTSKDFTSSKTKSSKPVLRSASILLRSKKLILSDSESEDEEKTVDPLGCQSKDFKEIPRPFGDAGSLSRKYRMKKHRRKKETKGERLFGQLCVGQSSFAQYFGKRKRSTATHQQSTSTCSDDIYRSSGGLMGEDGGVGSSFEPHSMDCESQSCDSSSLSESVCESDHFAEADDEQSDFYEVTSRSNRDPPKSGSSRSGGSGSGSGSGSSKAVSRTKYSPSIPIPQNPFASVPPTPSSSYNSLTGGSSSIIWKRRRRNH